jgi:hypothetical protein
VPFLIGILRVKFRLVWAPVQSGLASLLSTKEETYRDAVFDFLDRLDQEALSKNIGTDAETLYSLILESIGLNQTFATSIASVLINRFMDYYKTITESSDRHRLVSWLKLLGAVQKYPKEKDIGFISIIEQLQCDKDNKVKHYSTIV